MVHWLQCGGIKFSLKREEMQLNELKKYLKNYPAATAKVYIKTTSDVYAKVIQLECNQSYRDLDLDCNSMSDKSLKRLTQKPKDIAFSEYLTQQICNDVIQEKEVPPSILKQVEENKSKIEQTHTPDKQMKKVTSIE